MMSRCPEIIKTEIRMLEWVLNVFCTAELRESGRNQLRKKMEKLNEELKIFEDG